MSVYKNITLNDPGDLPPWGPTEKDAFKDIIDTGVLDTVTGIAEPSTGHHHHRMYSTTSNTLAIEVEDTDEKVVVKNALKVVSLDTGGGTEGGVVITDDEGNIGKLEFVDDGALLTANGSVITKLPSGIEGSVLTVDSTEPTGLKWGNKPTGSAFSYPYRYRTELVAPPISGSFRLNNGTQPSSTEMYIHKDADPSGDIHDLLDNRSVGDTIVLVATDNLDAYLEFTITSKVDNTTYITYGITNIAAGSSSLTGNEVVIVGFSNSRASVLPDSVFYADDFENPNNADWAVNGLAILGNDSNNAGLRVRTTGSAMGVGLSMIIPSTATNMTIEFKSRPETDPGAARTVGVGFYEREIGGAVGSWSSKITLVDLDITTNEDWLIDSETKTIAAWGLTAGSEHQMQFSRDTPTGGTDLTGDWTLRYIKISFT